MTSTNIKAAIKTLNDITDEVSMYFCTNDAEQVTPILFFCMAGQSIKCCIHADVTTIVELTASEVINAAQDPKSWISAKLTENNFHSLTSKCGRN